MAFSGVFADGQPVVLEGSSTKGYVASGEAVFFWGTLGGSPSSAVNVVWTII